jgi:hypothetical protein
MHLSTWGTVDPKTGARSMKWSVLAPELEAQLGLPPIAVFGAISRYGMQLDVDADQLTIADPSALAARIARDLRRA